MEWTGSMTRTDLNGLVCTVRVDKLEGDYQRLEIQAENQF